MKDHLHLNRWKISRILICRAAELRANPVTKKDYRDKPVKSQKHLHGFELLVGEMYSYRLNSALWLELKQWFLCVLVAVPDTEHHLLVNLPRSCSTLYSNSPCPLQARVHNRE